MERAVNDVDLNIDNRIAAEHAVKNRFINALLDRRDVFARDNAANNLVFDHETGAAAAGTHVDFNVAVLTATARLLDQLANAVRVGRDRFTIGDLRFAGVGIDFEFAKHAVANNFQMQLAHAGDDCLAGIFVCINAEGRIFFGETLQRDRHLFLI